jgi:hypothetical protein
MKLGILNTSIVTADGTYRLATVSRDGAVAAVQYHMDFGDGIDSAVGHESTAEILSTLLGTLVPVSRQLFEQQTGQPALVFKLNGRPEPGRELSIAELEEIGFTFKLLTRET